MQEYEAHRIHSPHRDNNGGSVNVRTPIPTVSGWLKRHYYDDGHPLGKQDDLDQDHTYDRLASLAKKRSKYDHAQDNSDDSSNVPAFPSRSTTTRLASSPQPDAAASSDKPSPAASSLLAELQRARNPYIRVAPPVAIGYNNNNNDNGPPDEQPQQPPLLLAHDPYSSSTERNRMMMMNLPPSSPHHLPPQQQPTHHHALAEDTALLSSDLRTAQERLMAIREQLESQKVLQSQILQGMILATTSAVGSHHHPAGPLIADDEYISRRECLQRSQAMHAHHPDDALDARFHTLPTITCNDVPPSQHHHHYRQSVAAEFSNHSLPTTSFASTGTLDHLKHQSLWQVPVGSPLQTHQQQLPMNHEVENPTNPLNQQRVIMMSANGLLWTPVVAPCQPLSLASFASHHLPNNNCIITRPAAGISSSLLLCQGKAAEIQTADSACCHQSTAVADDPAAVPDCAIRTVTTDQGLPLADYICSPAHDDVKANVGKLSKYQNIVRKQLELFVAASTSEEEEEEEEEVFPAGHVDVTLGETMRPVPDAICMAAEADVGKLSTYQIMIRKQLEFFVADQDDVALKIQGRKRPVHLGQVGIRCRHCAHLPVYKRARGSVYYPSKLKGIYQAAQNMAWTHLMESCDLIDTELLQELQCLFGEGQDIASSGKKYWAQACQSLGICESENGLQLATS